MKKKIVITALILLFVSAVSYHIFAIKSEINKNVLLEKQYQSGDFSKTYLFYVSQEIVVEDRPAVGTNPVTMIYVVDFTSQASKEALQNTLNTIQENYGTEKDFTRMYKYLISKEEYQEKSGKYLYAIASQCMLRNQLPDVDQKILLLFDLTESEIANMLTEQNLSLNECIKTEDVTLYEDMIQTTTYRMYSPSIYIGVNGRQNTVLYGDPVKEKLLKRIREKQIAIGEKI